MNQSFSLHVFLGRNNEPRVSVSLGSRPDHSLPCDATKDEYDAFVRAALRALGEREDVITKTSASSPALTPVEIP